MRKASLHRETKETNISVSWNLDGSGKADINTPIPFMNHMLELLTRHAYFDLQIQAAGDVEVDGHHLIEDLGIVMGTVFKQATGDKKGITRYGYTFLPMDESLVMISVDISNRPFLGFEVVYPSGLQQFDTALIKEFLSAFVSHAGLTLHVRLLSGDNAHHIIEAIFKGLARALAMALQYNPKEKDVPSTKGML